MYVFIQLCIPSTGGITLSNATCLTRVFFKSGESYSNNYGDPLHYRQHIKQMRPR